MGDNEKIKYKNALHRARVIGVKTEQQFEKFLIKKYIPYLFLGYKVRNSIFDFMIKCKSKIFFVDVKKISIIKNRPTPEYKIGIHKNNFYKIYSLAVSFDVRMIFILFYENNWYIFTNMKHIQKYIKSSKTKGDIVSFYFNQNDIEKLQSLESWLNE